MFWGAAFAPPRLRCAPPGSQWLVSRSITDLAIYRLSTICLVESWGAHPRRIDRAHEYRRYATGRSVAAARNIPSEFQWNTRKLCKLCRYFCCVQKRRLSATCDTAVFWTFERQLPRFQFARLRARCWAESGLPRVGDAGVTTGSASNHNLRLKRPPR
jgi:hypothetical protein